MSGCRNDIPAIRVSTGSSDKLNLRENLITPSFGFIRYDTTNHNLEVYEQNGWKDILINNKPTIDISGKLVVDGDVSFNGDLNMGFDRKEVIELAGAGALNGTGGGEGTARASSSLNTTVNNAPAAFNNSIAQYDAWLSRTDASGVGQKGMPQWIEFEFPYDVIVTKYKIWQRHTIADGQALNTWTLLAYPAGPRDRMYPQTRNFTSNSQIISGQSYGNGIYETNQSEIYLDNPIYAGWNAFNTAGGGGGLHWKAKYISGSYNGTKNLVTGYDGDWLTIKLPVQINLTKYGFKIRLDQPDRAPGQYKIYGSNNGSTWTPLVHKTSTISYTDDNFEESISKIGMYNYFGLVVNQLSGSDAFLNFSQWYIYGNEYDSAVIDDQPISVTDWENTDATSITNDTKRKEFFVDTTTTAYRRFRLNVTGAGDGEYLSIGELAFYGYKNRGTINTGNLVVDGDLNMGFDRKEVIELAGAGALNGTGGGEGTARASSSLNTTVNNAPAAFNNSIVQYDAWLSRTDDNGVGQKGMPQWIEFEFPYDVIVTKYKIWQRHTIAFGQAPKTWTLHAYPVGHVPLQRMYPPTRNLTELTTTISGQAYGNGTYDTSQSELFTDSFGNSSSHPPSHGFNETETVGVYFSDDNYNGGVNGIAGLYRHGFYNSNDPKFLKSGYTGDWLTIKLPVQINLTKYGFKQRVGHSNRAPGKYKIYGSNDGSDWTELVHKHIDSTITYTGNDNLYFEESISKMGMYNYFGLVVNQLYGRDDALNFDEWYIYGDEYDPVVIDHQPSVTNWESTTAYSITNDTERKEFFVNTTTTAYRRFRLNVTAAHDAHGEYLSIGELAFYGYKNRGTINTGNLVVNGFVGNSTTGALTVPSGTTDQQPTGVQGMIRFNSTSSRIEYYNGEHWKSVGWAKSANGGVVTNYTTYRVHTFTISDTFTVTNGGIMDFLIVGGGGGGGGRAGGGGGAGGLVYETNQNIVNGAYTVIVGEGGGGGIYNGTHGGNGSNSFITGNLSFLKTAVGGGGGAGTQGQGQGQGQGGSGGGGRYGGTGGASTQSALKGYGFGNSGGGSTGGGPPATYNAGGGGGAGAVGQSGTTSYLGRGGDGLEYDITGTNTYYAGGGGGGSHDPWPGARSEGGLGGGGYSGTNDTGGTAGADGVDGLGGGGGGGSTTTSNGGAGGDGGKGIVIIRYAI